MNRSESKGSGLLRMACLLRRWTALLTLMPVLVLAVSGYMQSVNSEMRLRSRELFAVARMLEIQLPASFDRLLSERQATARPAPEQVLVLNQVLQPIIDEAGEGHDEIGMGYYSIELDSALARGPVTDRALLLPRPHTDPQFEVYRTGRPHYFRLRSSRSHSGKTVVSWAYPIERDGRIIGHTWANVPVGHVYGSALRYAIGLGLTGLVVAGILIAVLNWVLRKWRNDLAEFAAAVENRRESVSPTMFSELRPILESVRSIEESTRDQAVAEFAACAVHEIRNPVTTAHALIQVLLGKEDDATKISWLLAVDRQLANIERLSQHFLLYAKPAKPEVHNILLDDLVAEISEELGPQCRDAGVHIDASEAVGSQIMCSCDPEQLKQVVLNLVTNGLDAMAGMDRRAIHMTAYREGNYARLRVSNSGPPIPDGIMEKVFEPFFSTKPGGTGLGLAISRRLLRQLGGDLSAQNLVEGGVAFIITLPLSSLAEAYSL